MVRGPPLEDQLPGPRVDFLEQTVKKRSVPCSPYGRQVVGNLLVDGKQCGALLREMALVLVRQPPAKLPHGSNAVLWSVLAVEGAAAAQVVGDPALALSEREMGLAVERLGAGSYDGGVLLIGVDEAQVVGAEYHGRGNAVEGPVYEEVCLFDRFPVKCGDLEDRGDDGARSEGLVGGVTKSAGIVCSCVAGERHICQNSVHEDGGGSLLDGVS